MMEEFINENLKKIVLIESESKGAMDEVIEFTVNLLDEIGVESRVVEGNGFNPVIIASHGDGGVCFSGHLDTVPLGNGWEHEQTEIVGDKMYGRGTLDMKGPCISVVAAAKKMVEKDIPFSLVFTTDEEVSMAGAERVSDEPEIVNAPAVVICEPTGGLVVTKEKGVYQFELTTKGKNAHASMPEKGENAIVKMLPILNKLNLKNNIPADDDELSCCIDVIEGGEATNVIPNGCRAEVDVRFPDMFNKKLLQKYLFDPIDEDFAIDEIQYLDPVKVDEDLNCIKKMLELADTDIWAVPYGTEMVIFSKTNPKTFIFGPGQVDMAHKPDEWISLSALYEFVDYYVEYAKIMVGQD
ncbi:MAG: M20/M25/M40 family metallo-hydrolase [Thermoplasmata archaeon]